MSKTTYCQIKNGSDWRDGRFEVVLHIHTAPIVGIETQQASTVGDFERLADAADKVMFYLSDFPRRAVAKDKCAKWFRKLVRVLEAANA